MVPLTANFLSEHMGLLWVTNRIVIIDFNLKGLLQKYIKKEAAFHEILVWWLIQEYWNEVHLGVQNKMRR